jgi:hypothetical protein
VLFPPDSPHAEWSDLVELQSTHHFDCGRWGDLARAIRDR